MANWYNQTLSFRGELHKVQEILDFIRGDKDEDGNEMYIDFNMIEPMPNDLPESEKRDWAIEHWGSHFNAFDQTMNETEYKISWRTKWTASVKIIKKLSNKFHGVGFILEGGSDAGFSEKEIIMDGNGMEYTYQDYQLYVFEEIKITSNQFKCVSNADINELIKALKEVKAYDVAITVPRIYDLDLNSNEGSGSVIEFCSPFVLEKVVSYFSGFPDIYKNLNYAQTFSGAEFRSDSEAKNNRKYLTDHGKVEALFKGLDMGEWKYPI